MERGLVRSRSVIYPNQLGAFSMINERDNVTLLLGQLGSGNQDAAEELMPLVYEHLKRIAHRQLQRERADHTLNTTALVHEAYMKLVDQDRVSWKNRSHFYAISSQAMRRILVNYAVTRKAQKRGGGQAIVAFDEQFFVQEARADELIALDEALQGLAKLSERQSKVVEYRFFGGMTGEEIADILGVSLATVRLDWRLAKAWLSRELSENRDTPS